MFDSLKNSGSKSNNLEITIKTGTPPRLVMTATQRLKELSVIFILLATSLTSVALFTFDPADPSWSQTAWGNDIHNAGGAIGAWIADTLFFGLGLLAYSIPAITLGLLLFYLYNRAHPIKRQDSIDFMLVGTKVLGGSLLLITSCGLANQSFDDLWYFSSGGMIGDVMVDILTPYLNTLGTMLLLMFTWGAGFTLLSGISWVSIVEWIGENVLTSANSVVKKVMKKPTEHVYTASTEKEVAPTGRVEKQSTPQHQRSDVQPVLASKEHHFDIPSLKSVDDSFDLNINDNDNVKKTGLNHSESQEIDLDSIEKNSERSFTIHMPKKHPQNKVAIENEEDDFDPLLSKNTGIIEPTLSFPQDMTIEDLERSNHLETTELADNISVDTPSFESSTTPWMADSTTDIDDFPTITLDEEERHTVTEDIYQDIGSFLPKTAVIEEDISHPSIGDIDRFNDIATWDGANTVDNIREVDNTNGINSTDERDFQPNSIDLEPIPTYDQEGDLASRAPVILDEPIQIMDSLEEPITEIINDETSIEKDTLLSSDQDVQAFQEIVKAAQVKEQASMNPFLVRDDVTLPKPKEPLPTLDLLYHPEMREDFIDKASLEGVARLVEAKLADYKIKARVVDIFPGPVITRYELELAPGVKASRISSLSMDLARSLSTAAVRVVEVIPGKPYIGIELPNISRQTVYLSDVISSEAFNQSPSPTTIVLGQDIAGEAVVADLSKMPHVLVAGTTGSGKSVGVNVMIVSMLYKSGPEDVRFIMIDPKMLELSIYEGIPHLLTEVVTDMKDAANALRWSVGEMERRYKLMSALGVRNVKGFNDKLKMAAEAGHPIQDPLWQPGDSMDEEAPYLEKLPYIVIIVDEFADLMMTAGKKVEELIARLAQKARAAGMHLVLATQRPSVDVITGLIKANIPTRVAFTVSTKTDSRTILDQGGAESLLGMGDMLYLPPGSNHTTRVHGAFASDDDVHAVVNNWKARGKPNYISDITSGEQGEDALLPGEEGESAGDKDALFDEVVEFVVESRKVSISSVQRRFRIGYNRAARIVEELESEGIVSSAGNNGSREVLAPAPNRMMN
ncbi:DNA translocase FtsK 4TM domain-containing protein [Vibrio sp.]|nr:DNA translocase FtsK 4TM domain-containing protein [Vibrio sp.]